MKALSIGKMRGLQQCSTPRGVFAMLAVDHRQNLRAALNPSDPSLTSDADLTAFKQQVIAHLAPLATAVLLDPEYGAAQCIASGALPGRAGLMVALEATGYTGDPTARQSAILDGWSVSKARRMGATALKLLVYYHPDSPTAPEIEKFVQQTGDECARVDMPLFLEPLSYSLNPAEKKLNPVERKRVVIETARRLTPLGVDVLKAEFPLDTQAQPDEAEWQAACAELTQASVAPWVLLSAAVDFEVYVRQVTAACRAGAAGVAVGRAVWKEATSLRGGERSAFLRGTAAERMQRMVGLCDALGHPWQEIYTAAEAPVDWHRTYPGL